MPIDKAGHSLIYDSLTQVLYILTLPLVSPFYSYLSQFLPIDLYYLPNFELTLSLFNGVRNQSVGKKRDLSNLSTCRRYVFSRFRLIISL